MSLCPGPDSDDLGRDFVSGWVLPASAGRLTTRLSSGGLTTRYRTIAWDRSALLRRSVRPSFNIGVCCADRALERRTIKRVYTTATRQSNKAAASARPNDECVFLCHERAPPEERERLPVSPMYTQGNVNASHSSRKPWKYRAKSLTGRA